MAWYVEGSSLTKSGGDEWWGAEAQPSGNRTYVGNL
jgi:hypothetical protein